jgi:hypothetical protein
MDLPLLCHGATATSKKGTAIVLITIVIIEKAFAHLATATVKTIFKAVLKTTGKAIGSTKNITIIAIEGS